MIRPNAASILAGATIGLLLSTTGASATPEVAGCMVFPTSSIWNTRIDGLPVQADSEALIASIGADLPLRPDFGSGLYEGAPIGIPFSVVPLRQAQVEIRFEAFDGEGPYEEESTSGPVPIPPDAAIEGGPHSTGDRHVLVIQEGSCTLFELYRAVPGDDGSWAAVTSVRFDLESNDLRVDGYTSADAAGLPIFPGLVRAQEVSAGAIEHALRFTVPRTRNAYVWPARHKASDKEDTALPAMGQRFRLRSDFDISGFSPSNQIILTALKTYGMVLADNGSPWFLSGAPDDAWDNDDLAALRQVKGSDFEAVDVSSLQVAPDSGEAAPGR